MKIKIFHGWYIVMASAIILVFYCAIYTFGWTSFVTPILATFGWTMTEFSLASTLRGIETGIFKIIEIHADFICQ